MHYHKKDNPFRLVNNFTNEVVYEFTNMDQLIHYWGYICRLDIGKTIKRKITSFDEITIRLARSLNDRLGESSGYSYIKTAEIKHTYCLRDSFGDFIDPDDVHNDRRKDKRYKYQWYRGRRRSAYGHHRSPKTTQERRWNYAWKDEEDAPAVRGGRSNRHLPNSWDDRISHSNKCWKRYRKTQWR